MVYVLLRTGEAIEIPEAEGFRVDGSQLLLLDALGKLVQMFATQDISAYGKHEAMGRASRFERLISEQVMKR